MIFAETTTWIDVASDAVKIGLGACIGGFFAILSLIQSHELELKREYAKRRRDELEKIAPSFESITTFSLNSISKNKAGYLQGQKPVGYDDVEKNLYELKTLEARLRLMNYPASAHLVISYHKYLHDLNHGGKPTDAQFDSLISDMIKARNDTFTQFAKDYENA